MSISKANEEAVERMIEARPLLVGLAKAREVIPGMHDNLLLHAGPPIEWERMSSPLRGAIIGALIFERRARNPKEARTIVERGALEFAPCHNYHSVGTISGVISPSMSVYILENQTDGNRAYSNLNEGYGKVLHYGAFDQSVQARLNWMEQSMAPILAHAIESSGGIDIKALLTEALHMGDEGHNRNKAASLLYLKTLAPHIVKVARDSNIAAAVLRAIGENSLAVLNPVMAACKIMSDAAHHIKGSTIVSVMARNGTDFGIRVSGLGDQWFTAPAEIPTGLYFSNYERSDANPDIGDSTIIETVGIGTFAMAAAPAIITFIGGKPKDPINATLEMYKITQTEHKYFTIPTLDFRGSPTGIDIMKVVETGITPRINTGIAHKEAGVGQIGVGFVRPPMSIFEEAVVTFAEQYGF